MSMITVKKTTNAKNKQYMGAGVSMQMDFMSVPMMGWQTEGSSEFRFKYSCVTYIEHDSGERELMAEYMSGHGGHGKPTVRKMETKHLKLDPVGMPSVGPTAVPAKAKKQKPTHPKTESVVRPSVGTAVVPAKAKKQKPESLMLEDRASHKTRR